MIAYDQNVVTRIYAATRCRFAEWPSSAVTANTIPVEIGEVILMMYPDAGINQLSGVESTDLGSVLGIEIEQDGVGVAIGNVCSNLA